MPAPEVGDEMRHRWVLDVLNDLQSYAEINDLPAIAAAAAQTLAIAEAEISAELSDEGDGLQDATAAD